MGVERIILHEVAVRRRSQDTRETVAPRLDENVRASLWELGWSSKLAARSSLRTDRYITYVETAAVWAQDVARETRRPGVRAEDVELALFQLGRRISRPERFRETG